MSSAPASSLVSRLLKLISFGIEGKVGLSCELIELSESSSLRSTSRGRIVLAEEEEEVVESSSL